MKFCTITGSRAEFFILKNLILNLQKEKKIKHNLLVTGSHTSKIFGKTINDIKKSNIKIKNIINLNFKGDKPHHIANNLAEGIKKFSKLFTSLKPDLILLLGDRYEIFSAAISAYMSKIPIAHFYGGEETKGSLDEGIRHSITQLSSIHFVANKKYFDRVHNLQIDKKFIYNVGSLGVDAIQGYNFLKKDILEKNLKLKFNKKNVLMTFHPETKKNNTENINNLKILLDCLKKLKDTSIIITMPGADHYFKSVQLELDKFKKKNKNVFLYKSLGHNYYFSLCRIVDFMIGNSSSGIIEMPSFKKGTINLGSRQLGRVQAKSIVNAKYNKREIMQAIFKIYSRSFKNLLKRTINPYEKKNSLYKVLNVLRHINFKKK